MDVEAIIWRGKMAWERKGQMDRGRIWPLKLRDWLCNLADVDRSYISSLHTYSKGSV